MSKRESTKRGQEKRVVKVAGTPERHWNKGVQQEQKGTDLYG